MFKMNFKNQRQKSLKCILRGKMVLLEGKIVLHKMSKHIKTKGQNVTKHWILGFGLSSCIAVEL